MKKHTALICSLFILGALLASSLAFSQPTTTKGEPTKQSDQKNSDQTPPPASKEKEQEVTCDEEHVACKCLKNTVCCPKKSTCTCMFDYAACPV